MNKHQHPSNNAVLGAPDGWDQSQLPVSALPITRIDLDGTPAVVSYWKPSESDLAILAQGGSISLCILGTTMPPVCLSVDPQ